MMSMKENKECHLWLLFRAQWTQVMILTVGPTPVSSSLSWLELVLLSLQPFEASQPADSRALRQLV